MAGQPRTRLKKIKEFESHAVQLANAIAETMPDYAYGADDPNTADPIAFGWYSAHVAALAAVEAIQRFAALIHHRARKEYSPTPAIGMLCWDMSTNPATLIPHEVLMEHRR